MLGAAGFIIPEAFNKFGANCGPEAVWFKVVIYILTIQSTMATRITLSSDDNEWLKCFYFWMQTGALLLDGNTLNYFGKNIPINLVVAVIAEVILVGGAEYYRIINGLVWWFNTIYIWSRYLFSSRFLELTSGLCASTLLMYHEWGIELDNKNHLMLGIRLSTHCICRHLYAYYYYYFLSRIWRTSFTLVVHLTH